MQYNFSKSSRSRFRLREAKLSSSLVALGRDIVFGTRSKTSQFSIEVQYLYGEPAASKRLKDGKMEVNFDIKS